MRLDIDQQKCIHSVSNEIMIIDCLYTEEFILLIFKLFVNRMKTLFLKRFSLKMFNETLKEETKKHLFDYLLFVFVCFFG